MRNATGLWWEITINCWRTGEADGALLRSGGNPQAVIAELWSWSRNTRELFDRWRDARALHGHNLRRLDLSGPTSDVMRLQWIFDEPLPLLNHLKIHFYPEPQPPGLEDPNIPVTLRLPTDMPLRSLDLRNTKLPWPSNLFSGLSELRLDFGGCNTVDISEDALLVVLGASPLLERLSLSKVGPRTGGGGDIGYFTPGRPVQLQRLISLELDNSPGAVSWIMAHIDIPAITSLEISSFASDSMDFERSLDLLIPDHRLQKRLFTNPPLFEIKTIDDGPPCLMVLTVGSFKMYFEFDNDNAMDRRDKVVARIGPLVPRSLETLRVDFAWLGDTTRLEWGGFLTSHSKLQSIECLCSSSSPEAESLWDALSPSWDDSVTLCPKLESISLIDDPPPNLFHCLLDRQELGFELEHLKMKTENTFDQPKLVEKFGPLVGTLEVDRPKGVSFHGVSPFSAD